jgi:hypothetical protein
MAITATTNIANGTRFAAFGAIPVKVTTDTSTVKMIKVELKVGSAVLATEYSNVFLKDSAYSAFFNLRGTFGSLFGKTANIVTAAAAGAPSAIAAQMTEHYKVVDVVFSEYITEPINPVTRTGVIAYKSANLMQSLWADNDNDFLGFDIANNQRTAFENEFIYPTVYRLATGDSVLRVNSLTTITAAPVNNFAQFRVKVEKQYVQVGGYFLPSRDELVAMRNELYLYGLGGFIEETHWTSSETDATKAKALVFMAGTSVVDAPKNEELRVRPARLFTRVESSFSLNIRDIGEAGGYIFARATEAGISYYYEAAPSDISGYHAWSNIIDTFIGSEFTYIGAGLLNTPLIIAQAGHTESAASKCVAVTHNATNFDPIKLRTVSGSTVRSKEFDIYIDSNIYPRRKTLHFINQYGAWDFYNVIDYEEKVLTEKSQYTKYSDFYGTKAIHQHIESKVKELKCFGREGTAQYLRYIEALVTSPVVYDEAGVRVRVLDDKILTDAEGLLQPEFTIQYVEQDVINF